MNKLDFYESVGIWKRASVSLVDVRYKLISKIDPTINYKLPVSTFIFAEGKGEILLDENSYKVDRFGIFHGGKGTRLSIYPSGQYFEYYLVLYRSSSPKFGRREFEKRIKHVNPFQLQYGFTPDNPIFFTEQFKKMYVNYQKVDELEQFYAKGAFYRLVFEIYNELSTKNISVLYPDLIAMAKRYIDENYSEGISIQSMASYVGMSDSNFRRRFKNKYGESPQGYLMSVRILAAKHKLANKNLAIREIAAFCGFTDEFHFCKLFLKKTGMSPTKYRTKIPNDMSDNSMEVFSLLNYNVSQRVSYDELEREGVIYMLKKIKNNTLAAVTVSLVLLLAACNTNTATTSRVESVATNATDSQTISENQTVALATTRVINTIMGEVEVPVAPKRIASFGYPGDLIAMGITPVCGDTQSRLFDGIVDDENYTYLQADEYEEIMKLEPDLILISNVANEEMYHKLSAIAPTILTDAINLSLPERIALTGDVVGIGEAAQKAMEEFEIEAQKYKQELMEAGIEKKTITVMEGNYLFSSQYGRGADIVYNYLGFQAPEKLQESFDKGEMYLEVSMETLSQYCGDYILNSVWEGSEDLSQNEVWNSIPAVQNNQVIEIDFSDYFSRDLYTSKKQMKLLTESFLSIAETK